MLILASQSAARTALLQGAGLRFETSPAPIDERSIEAAALGKGDGAEIVAKTLAEGKAIAVSARRPGAVVIGADQVLAFEGRMLHKPGDRHAAVQQLTTLRGKTHKLHSGLALARNNAVLWSAIETATLTMRAFSDAERDAVLGLEGDGVFGSLGGYRLEGPSIRLFETIAGDYFTILGLPLLPLLAALRLHAPETLDPAS